MALPALPSFKPMTEAPKTKPAMQPVAQMATPAAAPAVLLGAGAKPPRMEGAGDMPSASTMPAPPTPSIGATAKPVLSAAAPGTPPAPARALGVAGKLSDIERAVMDRHYANVPTTVNGPLAVRAEVGGQHYVIPTVWRGQTVPPGEAYQRAQAHGLENFPVYANAEEAAARYQQMHAMAMRGREGRQAAFESAWRQ